MNTVRTRFAPSPTGYLHLGGLRTALLANPVTMPMELFRRVLLGVGTVHPLWLALSAAIALLVALAGLAAFRHTEHTFIDTV